MGANVRVRARVSVMCADGEGAHPAESEWHHADRSGEWTRHVCGSCTWSAAYLLDRAVVSAQPLLPFRRHYASDETACGSPPSGQLHACTAGSETAAVDEAGLVQDAPPYPAADCSCSPGQLIDATASFRRRPAPAIDMMKK